MSAARLRFATLQGAGWSLRAIAAHAGVSINSLCRWRDGADLPHVDRALLTVDPVTIPERTMGTRLADPAEPFVPRIGTVRRIQALMFMGWTHKAMREHCGLRTHVLLSQQGRWVTRTTHDKVAAMYRDLSHRNGGNERAAAWARKLGYVGPAAWDDIDHDEAPEKPENLCAVDGCLNTAEWTYDPARVGDSGRRCRRHNEEARGAA